MTDQVSPTPSLNPNPSIMSHVSAGTNKLEEAVAFYDIVLATIGATRIMHFEGEATAYGKTVPEFWVHPPYNGEPCEVGNGAHFAFNADNEAAVHAFYEAAIEAGAKCDGEPGPRPHYGPAYYGCFVRDLDGHKIEAMFWDESKLVDSQEV